MSLLQEHLQSNDEGDEGGDEDVQVVTEGIRDARTEAVDGDCCQHFDQLVYTFCDGDVLHHRQLDDVVFDWLPYLTAFASVAVSPVKMAATRAGHQQTVVQKGKGWLEREEEW